MTHASLLVLSFFTLATGAAFGCRSEGDPAGGAESGAGGDATSTGGGSGAAGAEGPGSAGEAGESTAGGSGGTVGSSGGEAGSAITSGGASGGPVTDAGAAGAGEAGSGNDGASGMAGASSGSSAVSALTPEVVALDEETILDEPRCEWSTASTYEATYSPIGYVAADSTALAFDRAPGGATSNNRINVCGSNGSLTQPAAETWPLSPPAAFTPQGSFLWRRLAATGPLVHVSSPWTEAESTDFDNYGDRIEYVFVRSGGSGTRVYNLGAASQLPSESAELVNSLLLTQYTLDGARAWQKRLASLPLDGVQDIVDGIVGAATDGDDNFYLGITVLGATDTHRVAAIDSAGEFRWLKEFVGGGATSPAIQVAADGSAFVYAREGSVTRLALDGTASWRHSLTFEHETEIDPTEGVIWRGAYQAPILRGSAMNAATLLVRADGSICIGGNYRNTYQNGSTPRRPHDNVMIACLSDTGEVLWAKQYGVPFQDPFANRDGLRFLALGETQAGELVLVATGEDVSVSSSSPDRRRMYVFDLDAQGAAI